MKNQVKYVLQGVLLMILVIFLFCFISFVTSVRLVEPEPVNVADNITLQEPATKGGNTRGQNLFSANCASCHSIHKRLTGPALAGFEQRGPWKDRKQMYAWIHNPDNYIKNNSYTKELYKEYQVMMTPFPDLTNQEINDIIIYVNQNFEQYTLPMASRI